MRTRLLFHSLVNRGDGGNLVLVLVIAMFLLSVAGLGPAAAVGGLSLSSQYSSFTQAGMASQSGVDAALQAMRSASTFSALPCSLQGTLSAGGSSSSYSVAVAYSAAGASIACSGATLGGTSAPTSAVVLSTGSAVGARPVVTKADVSVTVPLASVRIPGYVIFTEGNLGFTNTTSLNRSSYGTPDLYAGQTFTCTNVTTSDGNLVTYQPFSPTNQCSFKGSVISGGAVAIGHSSVIGGDVVSYGGGVALNTATVKGNVTAMNSGGTISLSSSTVSGNADAAGSISVGSGSSVGGRVTPNDGAMTGRGMTVDYPPIGFPVMNPAIADWLSQGWTVVQVPAASCSSYFSDSLSDQFISASAAATRKTVFYAPSCNVQYTAAHTFSFGADIVLQVQSLVLIAGNNVFQSTTSAAHSFSVLAAAGQTCSTTVDIKFVNQALFSNLHVFMYTSGVLNFTNKETMTGQLFACGGFTGVNSLGLTYDPLAAQGLPGTQPTGVLTVVVEDRYRLS